MLYQILSKNETIDSVEIHYCSYAIVTKSSTVDYCKTFNSDVMRDSKVKPQIVE